MYKIEIEWTEIQAKVLADFGKKGTPVNVVPDFDAVPCRKCGLKASGWGKSDINGKSFVRFYCYPCGDNTELYAFEVYIPNPNSPWRS